MPGASACTSVLSVSSSMPAMHLVECIFRKQYCSAKSDEIIPRGELQTKCHTVECEHAAFLIAGGWRGQSVLLGGRVLQPATHDSGQVN